MINFQLISLSFTLQMAHLHFCAFQMRSMSASVYRPSAPLTQPGAPPHLPCASPGWPLAQAIAYALRSSLLASYRWRQRSWFSAVHFAR